MDDECTKDFSIEIRRNRRRRWCADRGQGRLTDANRKYFVETGEISSQAGFESIIIVDAGFLHG
jgi:hypothetical protein